MEFFATLGTIFVVHMLGLMSPGPDFIMCAKNSLTYSRRTGIYTAIGFALGIAVHVAYCLAGLALVISKSIIVFNVIKLLGAAYLIYIGVKSIMAKRMPIEINASKKKDISPMKAIKIGFLTNVLNPKATMFFLGMFTLVISPDTPAFTMAVASVMMVVTTAIWFSIVAIFLTHPKIQGVVDRAQGAINKTFGALLVALGMKIALTKD